MKDGKCYEHRRKWDTTRRRSRLTVNGWEEQRRAKRVIARDGTVCCVCGLMGSDQADHVVPLWENGPDDPGNMAAIHAECHKVKTKAEVARQRKARAAR